MSRKKNLNQKMMNLELQENKRTRILYHVAFWVTYIFSWSFRDMVFYPYFFQNIFQNLLTSLFFAPLVYFNLYFLLPRFLLKRKYLLYTIIILSSLFTSALLSAYLQSILFTDYFGTITGFVILASDALELCLFSTIFKLLKSWYQKEKYMRRLENKNHEAEINYLKAQINPHFLFNTLNNIYFSIPKKPEVAREIVLQLSDMLSHQLYEARQAQVSLKKELDYLIKYIELEKIRQGEIVQVNYQFSEISEEWEISPLLLLPFVENAFKHGNKTALEGYWVDISAKIEDNYFLFEISNSCEKFHKEQTENSGIGLENVRRRLELIYPKKHELKIQQSTKEVIASREELEEERVFEVKLKLDLL